MLISSLSAEQFSQFLGSEATIDDAKKMASLLESLGHDDTRDIPDEVWIDCLNKIGETHV